MASVKANFSKDLRGHSQLEGNGVSGLSSDVRRVKDKLHKDEVNKKNIFSKRTTRTPLLAPTFTRMSAALTTAEERRVAATTEKRILN